MVSKKSLNRANFDLNSDVDQDTKIFGSHEIVSEYDQEIPQSETADKPWHREEEPLNHHETPGRQIKQSNQLSLHHQDDASYPSTCKSRYKIDNALWWHVF